MPMSETQRKAGNAAIVAFAAVVSAFSFGAYRTHKPAEAGNEPLQTKTQTKSSRQIENEIRAIDNRNSQFPGDDQQKFRLQRELQERDCVNNPSSSKPEPCGP